MSDEPEPIVERAAVWGRLLYYAVLLFFVMTALARCGGNAAAGPAMWWSLLALFVVVNLGVMVPTLGMFARPILAVQRGPARNRIALTFDDGPHPTETQRVLDLLDQDGHKATFFIVGEQAERHRALLQEVVRRGHTLANHSYYHLYSTPFTNPSKLSEELMRTNALIADIQGHGTRFFRAPVGLVSPRVRKAAELAGLEIIGWTAKARDGWSSTTAEAATQRLAEALRPGAILLLHDGTDRASHVPIAADVLAQLLPKLKEAGLRSVPLDELLDPNAPAQAPAG